MDEHPLEVARVDIDLKLRIDSGESRSSLSKVLWKEMGLVGKKIKVVAESMLQIEAAQCRVAARYAA